MPCVKMIPTCCLGHGIGQAATSCRDRRSRRGYNKGTSFGICIERWQCLPEEVHVALDVGGPALLQC